MFNIKTWFIYVCTHEVVFMYVMVSTNRLILALLLGNHIFGFNMVSDNYPGNNYPWKTTF